MRKSFAIILCIFLLVQPAFGQVDRFVGKELTFQVTELADYTNHIDDSMLITVEGNKQVAYTIRNFGGSNSSGFWISGISQVEIANEVQIGTLYNSGFNAKSGGEKTATVSPFNLSLPSSLMYSNISYIQPTPFLANQSKYVTPIDGNTYPSVIVGLNQSNFITDMVKFLDKTNSVFTNYKNQITSAYGSERLTVGVSRDPQSFSYDVSGDMPDYHVFTYHPENISSIGDYNQISIDGGFNIEYDDDGILNEYNEEYEINYGEITILQYSYTISAREGSLGNVQVGNAGVLPSPFPITYIIIAVIAIPILIYYVKKLRK